MKARVKSMTAAVISWLVGDGLWMVVLFLLPSDSRNGNDTTNEWMSGRRWMVVMRIQMRTCKNFGGTEAIRQASNDVEGRCELDVFVLLVVPR